MPGGRPRKSIELRLLDGTYEPGRHGPLPEPAESEPPKKPGGLSGEAGKIWDRVFPLIAPVARQRDTLLIAEMCRWWAELKRCQTALKKTKPGERGYNQLIVATGICSDKVDKFAARFGMTPSDRAKLRAEMAGPVAAKVPTRPKTKLDASGKPG